jgi:hypothetical protein
LLKTIPLTLPVTDFNMAFYKISVKYRSNAIRNSYIEINSNKQVLYERRNGIIGGAICEYLKAGWTPGKICIAIKQIDRNADFDIVKIPEAEYPQYTLEKLAIEPPVIWPSPENISETELNF